MKKADENDKQDAIIHYILNQAENGYHFLFDLERLRNVFLRQNDNASSFDEMDSVENHLENVMRLPSILRKKTYIENLNDQMYSLVVKTYFLMMEDEIFSIKSMMH